MSIRELSRAHDKSTMATKTVRLAAASGSPIRVEGDARLEFVRGGKKCNIKFLDAGVKRLLASVSAIVDNGNVVVFGPQESYIERTSTGQRIPMSGAVVRTSGYEIEEYGEFDEPNTNSFFSRPA